MSTTLLSVSKLLDSLSELDIVTNFSEDYMEISSVDRLGSECCRLLAENGYWETHDFGMFSEVSDSFKHDKNNYSFNAVQNSQDYCSNLLAFFENRDKHVFVQKEVSTSLYLKLEHDYIVGLGLLKRLAATPKRIYSNTQVYTNTLFVGYAEFFIPTHLRKNGYGSQLASYINKRLISEITDCIPIVGAVGRALPLLTHNLICPVTPRDITHCSYIDDISLKIADRYKEISKVISFPLFIKESDTSAYKP